MEELAKTLASSVITEGVGPAGRILKKFGREKYDEFIVTYTNAFKSHLEWADERTQSVKNMIYRDRRAKLNDCYVATNFKSSKSLITDTEILESVKSGNRLIVSGTAGSGKTMLLKWVVQELLNTSLHHNVIPIVIDIKEITESDLDKNFAHFIYSSSVDKSCNLTFNQFLEGFNQGLLCVFIDAVDEIPPKLRDSVIKSILYLGRNYKKVGLLVTTRPDERLELGVDFDTLHTCPLDIHQATTVIEKIDFDEDTKANLIESMRNGLFEKHKSFLSNPLLVTIMLLTYNQWANVPIKFTNYYKLAFEALFQRHDATKSFTRKKHTDLEIDEFRMIFSQFSYRTYINNLSEFSLDDLLALSREAIDYFKSETSAHERAISAKDFTLDCIESTCLLQRDGLVNVFSHRSFQEYFTARFCCDYRGTNFSDIIEAALSRGPTENVFPMMHEIDVALIESQFVMPFTQEFLSRFGKKRTVRDKISLIMKECFDDLNVRVSDGVIDSYSISGPIAIFHSMSSVYPSLSVSEIFSNHSIDFFEYFRSELLKDEESEQRWKIIQEIGSKSNDRILIKSSRIPKWIESTSIEEIFDQFIDKIRNFHREMKNKEKSRNSTRRVLLEPL